MEISASIVKKLRDATGAGMMDCKKALVEADGDIKKAEKILKEMGLAAIAKRAGRATNNGLISTLVKSNKAVMLEMACETDFVARNEDFIALGNQLCHDVIDNGYTTIVAPLEEKVQELISKIKENMSLKRFDLIDIADNEMVVQYVHGEGSLGVLVKIGAESKEALEDERVKEFANDCALHIAAFNPLYFSKKEVDEAYIKEQTEIFTAQSATLDKPEKILQGIIQGKLNKHLSEVCFLQQNFVKDDSLSVEKKLEQLSKEVGTPLHIKQYLYYKVGIEE